MARKTKTVLATFGRDDGKSFLITELSATQGDAWANKTLSAAAQGGVDVRNMEFQKIAEIMNINGEGKKAIEEGRPVDIVGGMLELANLSITALGNIEYEVLQEQLDTLIERCVQVLPSGGIPRPLLSIDDEIEEIATLWLLRKEAFTLHVDFLAQGNS